MLQLPALIEPLADRPGYRGRVGEPFNLAAEAATAEEVVRLLAGALAEKVAAGARIAAVPVPGFAGPPAAGWLPDDELTQEWRDGVEAYRRRCDEEDRKRTLGEPADEKVAP
jgi:hypothetical protein